MSRVLSACTDDDDDDDGYSSSDASPTIIEDFKLECYISTCRTTDLLTVVGPLLNAAPGEGFDKTLFAIGMRYEAISSVLL